MINLNYFFLVSGKFQTDRSHFAISSSVSQKKRKKFCVYVTLIRVNNKKKNYISILLILRNGYS